MAWDIAYRQMPARLAFAIEHCHWVSNGFECIKASRGTLEDELAQLSHVLND